MATALVSESGELKPVKPVNARNLTCVIVSTDWNREIVRTLAKGARTTLLDAGIPEENVISIRVPGAVELTFGAAHAIRRYKPSVVITLGCVIRGDTPHFDYVCQSVTQGVTTLNATGEVPVIFGVLTVENLEQAQERAGGILGNKGAEAAIAAIKMVNLKAQ